MDGHLAQSAPIFSVLAHLCEGGQTSHPCPPSARETSRAGTIAHLTLHLSYADGKKDAR